MGHPNGTMINKEEERQELEEMFKRVRRYYFVFSVQMENYCRVSILLTIKILLNIWIHAFTIGNDTIQYTTRYLRNPYRWNAYPILRKRKRSGMN